MYKIIKKTFLNKTTALFEIKAQHIANSYSPGQFIILRINEKGERIPLTISNINKKKGTITIICQAVGFSTKKILQLKINSHIKDVVGPLGHKINIKHFGNVITIAGGVGIAELYPINQALKKHKNNVTSIIGAKTKSLIILEQKLQNVCNKLYVTTDDGTYAQKGFVTNVLEKILKQKKIDLVFAVGPIPMMQKVSLITKHYNIKTIVSLNAIMVDGTGMCGSCRIKYNNKIKFTCVDGPHFDAHCVDFDELTKRQGIYKDKEKIALKKYKCQCKNINSI